ncbi:hypothetical protein B0T13DRAFT_471619 [Neurospora crassa]|nr:hypothetical protein B0T13DRAFT_471619 [Neurospora crassa]
MGPAFDSRLAHCFHTCVYIFCALFLVSLSCFVPKHSSLRAQKPCFFLALLLAPLLIGLYNILYYSLYVLSLSNSA